MECRGDESFLPETVLADTSLLGSDPRGEEAKKSQLSWVESYLLVSISQSKTSNNSHQLEFGDGRPELPRTKGE
jgi:hypothetical protein